MPDHTNSEVALEVKHLSCHGDNQGTPAGNQAIAV